MKCLLIGGAGFIGSWLTKELIQNNYKVIIIGPFSKYDFGLKPHQIQTIIKFRREKLFKHATIYRGRFEEIGEEIIEKEKPDVIIHLAGHAFEHAFDSEFAFKQLTYDIGLTYQIVAAVKKHAVKKFVFLSSISAYGNFNYSTTETARLNPKTPYGISKASGEYLITSELDNWNIVRTASVYGFGDINTRATQIIINKIINGEKFWINENIWLDFIYVKDLAAGITHVLKNAPVRETFHISGGKALKLSDYVGYLKHHFKKMNYEIKKLQDRTTRGTMDNTKARILLNWQPKYTLETGIKDYLRYIKKYNIG